MPSLVDNHAVTLVAAGWLVVIGGIVAKGIKLTSYTQIAFTVVEVGVVALLIAVAAMCFPSAPAHAFFRVVHRRGLYPDPVRGRRPDRIVRHR